MGRLKLLLTFVVVLVAFSCALFLAAEEAQAKENSAHGSGQKQAGDARGGEATKQVEGALGGGASEPARGKEQPGGGGGDKTKLEDSVPRPDGPAPVDTKPVLEKAGETVGSVSQTTEPAVKEASETVQGTATPALEGTKETLGKVTEPVRQAAEPAVSPVLDAVEPVAKPVVEKVAPTVETATQPVLKEATSITEPVLNKAARTVEPVLGTTAPLVEPIEEEASPVVEAIEPVLDKATPPIHETVEPVSQTTAPLVEPVLGEAAPPLASTPFEAVPSPIESSLGATAPGVEPALEALEPVAGPVLERATPTFEPVFGEGAAPPTIQTLASSPVTPPSVLGAAEGGTALNPRPAPHTSGNAAVEAASSYRTLLAAGESRAPPTAGLFLGSHPSLFDSSLDSGHRAILGSAMTKGAPNHTPRPFPFGFPAGAPPVASASGGSGIGLDLLAVLALLSIVSRVGTLLWSFRESFGLISSLRLAVERPG